MVCWRRTFPRRAGGDDYSQHAAVHQYQRLPSLRDRFNRGLTITLARVENGHLVLAVPGHSLVLSQPLAVAGGELQNPIVAATDNGDGTYRLEMQFNHQLTEPRQPLDPTTVRVGATIYTIAVVPNRRTFEIEAPAGGLGIVKAFPEPRFNPANAIQDGTAFVGRSLT
ncbi:hypothetical protein [Pseudoxanthomonas sp. UTMC 1351]|uniref:hypothetical protein n=1 Tax=Pseudoxanthomonas sp. UTMC 1351 TaxID=2695853 RepID=UPI0034CDA04B